MTADRLAALLHEAITRVGWASCVHSPENEWLPFCEVAAFRLAAAGVTVAAQPCHWPHPQVPGLIMRSSDCEHAGVTVAAQPDGLDVERLAEALRRSVAVPFGVDGSPHPVWTDIARQVAREYGAVQPAPDALPFAESQRFYNEGYAAGRRAADEDHRDRDKMCPDCGHPHLPMLEPWEMLGTRVDPMCNWPVGPDACECRRRTLPQPAPDAQTDDPATHDPRCISVSRWHVGECYLPQPAPDALRAAAQAVVEANERGDAIWPAIERLRAALGDEPDRPLTRDEMLRYRTQHGTTTGLHPDAREDVP